MRHVTDQPACASFIFQRAFDELNIIQYGKKKGGGEKNLDTDAVTHQNLKYTYASRDQRMRLSLFVYMRVQLELFPSIWRDNKPEMSN